MVRHRQTWTSGIELTSLRQGFGTEIPEWNHSIHTVFLRQCIHSVPVQLLTSRSHSNSIPHHSNSIPVNPEVYTKLPNSWQFHQDKVHMEYILVISVSHHQFTPYIIFFGFSSYIFPSCILDLWTVAYTTSHKLADMLNSLGPKFSSQGHFHSIQLLNISQFLFSRLARLKTAPRGNFSHA